MSFENEIRAAAQKADQAVNEVMADYSGGYVTDEDDITGLLLGNLRNSFNGIVEGLQWKASILRHRAGIAAEEKTIGADMLIHVTLDTPTQTYSKGVLVQAKRVQPGLVMSKDDHADLIDQCRKMLSFSPASFVFDYAKGSMRCGSAMKVEGDKSRELYKVCDWRSYRFFLELFRCPIGDRSITSALVHDLLVPRGIEIKGKSLSLMDRA